LRPHKYYRGHTFEKIRCKTFNCMTEKVNRRSVIFV
jgi:hypothetical protein